MKKRFFHNEAFFAILTQFFLLVVFSVWIWVVSGMVSSNSFFLGGMICVLANAFYYWRVFSHFGASAAKRILKAFYWGQCIKMLLTAVGFAVTLLISHANPLYLFAGYMVTQGSFWLAPLGLSLIRIRNNKATIKNLGIITQ